LKGKKHKPKFEFRTLLMSGDIFQYSAKDLQGYGFSHLKLEAGIAETSDTDSPTGHFAITVTDPSSTDAAK